MPDDFISGALAGQQFQLNKFLIQEAPIKLEQEKMALTIAKQDYSKREQLAQMLASKPPPQGANPLENATNTFFTMAADAAQVGLPEEAASYLGKAATLSVQAEDAAYKQWERQKQQSERADKLLSGVSSQEEFDEMNKYIELTDGKPSALKGQKYSPELVENLKKAAAAKRTAAQEALDKARADREEAAARADEALVDVRKSQVQLNSVRARTAAKFGADGMQAKARTVTDTIAEIQKIYQGSLDPAAARTFANEIALDAERISKDEGKTMPQAIAAAVQYAKNHGTLAGVPVTKDRPGTSMKKPLPMPSKPEDARDQAWYQTPDGPRWYDAETQKFYKGGEGPDEQDDE